MKTKAKETDSTKHSYVYKLIEKSTNKFYIGYRTCLKSTLPNDDLGVMYFSSGTFKDSYKKFPELYTKEILAVFDEKTKAYEFEQLTIRTHFKDPCCANRNYDRGIEHKISGKVKYSKEFNQEILNMSVSKRTKFKRDEKKRLKRVQSYENRKKNYIQYCDLETRAIVYMIP